MLSPLTKDDLEHYRKDGFVILRELFPKEQMLELKSRIEELVFEQQEDNTDGVPVFFLDNIPQLYLDFCSSPLLRGILHQLIGPRVEFLSLKPVYKNAQITFPSSWHQDYPYWGGTPKVSIWIALDDATRENGCLRFLPEAHTTFLKHHKREGTFGNFLEEEQLDLSKAIDAPMQSGDACFFSDLAPHASYGNSSGKDRWSFIPTYRNADEPDPSEIWSNSFLIEEST